MSIKLDKKDVKAIADARVVRRNKRMLFIAGGVSLALVIVAVWVTKSHDIVSYVIGASGIIIFYGYLIYIDRLQKRERKTLLEEWGEE